MSKKSLAAAILTILTIAVCSALLYTLGKMVFGNAVISDSLIVTAVLYISVGFTVFVAIVLGFAIVIPVLDLYGYIKSKL